MKTTVILSQDDIRTIVGSVGIDALMDELMDCLFSAFRDFDPQQIRIPRRQGFSYTEPQPGLLEWMPLLHRGSQALMKMVGYHPLNPESQRLPTILSSFSLYDATNGHLDAIVDGTLLTALRTGAASGVASRLLGSPGSSTIGIIGCGAQAVTQLHAMSRSFDVCRVLYYDADLASSSSFRQRARFMGNTVSFLEASLEEIVSGVDILCVATSVDVGAGPVFEDVQSAPHLHINAIGSDFPGKFEVPKSLLQRCYVTPDCREQALLEGECQQLDVAEIGDDLCQLLRQGDAHSSLQSTQTVFDSTGWALEDYEVTKLILRHADRLGIGAQMELETNHGDPKNPYELISSRVKVDQAAAVRACG